MARLVEVEYEKIFSPKTMASLKGKSGESLRSMLGNKDLMQTMRRSQALLDEIIDAEEGYRDELEMVAAQMATDAYPIIDYANIRIEFAGYAYQPDKEINGITFGSVGSGTVIDYIQVSFANDDAFEWFGGTVNCKHIVSYRNLDDDFDTDFGYRGKVQFGLIIRDPFIADQSAGSTSEGFESDNDGSGSNNGPKTAAVFSNITAIGPLRGNLQATIDPKFRRAWLHNTKFQLIKLIYEREV